LCGLVDAACFLAFGEVFAEMMTGNLLLLCFRIGTGHSVFHQAVYLIALGAFALGNIAGGRLVRGPPGHTPLGLLLALGVLATAVLLSMPLPLSSLEPARDVVIALLAFAMGMQNALLRRHGVPDLATNVMTLTLTALVADSRLGGGKNERWQRRFGSIGMFMLGAGFGAALPN